MNRFSAVDFPTPTRVHMGLAVRNLKSSQQFYETLLDMPASKLREGYAKFESHHPPINLTLNQGDSEEISSHPVTHFGIQVKSTDAVAREAERLRTAGLETRFEAETTCCYAVQNKVWVTDPDGNAWEIFVVTQADAESYGSTRKDRACCSTASDEQGPCC